MFQNNILRLRLELDQWKALTVGDSMYEGAIYVAGEIASLGSDAKTEEISEDEVIDVLAALGNHGITKRYTFKKVVSAKRLYHYDSLERLEKTII